MFDCFFSICNISFGAEFRRKISFWIIIFEKSMYIERINSNQCQNTRHTNGHIVSMCTIYGIHCLCTVIFIAYYMLYSSSTNSCRISIYLQHRICAKFRMESTQRVCVYISTFDSLKFKMYGRPKWNWCKHFESCRCCRRIYVVVFTWRLQIHEFEIHLDCELACVHLSVANTTVQII